LCIFTDSFFRFFVDKVGGLCLNNHNIQKDVDGNPAFSQYAPESRRTVRAGAKRIGGLLPESVL
jgi:hypothetical protein